MNADATMAMLAMEHLHFAALLASLFAAVTVAYLLAFAIMNPDRRRGSFVLHTLFLLWQSNVAFVAVVTLFNASALIEQGGAAMSGWRLAPFMAPSAVLLYTAVLILSVYHATRPGGAGATGN